MADFPAVIDLSTLDGSDGFRLDGVDANDRSGFSVSSAGDVNGDGFDDILIGAYKAAPGGDSAAGESYVVFGKASGFTASVDLSGLDGSDGFRLDGIDSSDHSGQSVSSAGDVNGDGFDDIIIGAVFADPNGDSEAGESYVVFGKATGFGASLDLSGLDGSNGFRLDGIDASDRSGRSVSTAGDVNGDGFDDIIIGAHGAMPGGDPNTGESYVIFGKASGFAGSVDLSSLDGSDGFRLDGIDGGDKSGYSVSSAGDINGDGFDDIVIGAYDADPGGDSRAGESYVVFGKASGFISDIDLSFLDGNDGFRLDGSDANDRSGYSVSSAGDVNGDGFDDIIIGAFGADSGNPYSYTGESYVIFGKATGFTAVLDLATIDGVNGFRLAGVDANDKSSYSVSSAGDVNGDGFDDIIIGAVEADPGGDFNAGESYVVFGKAAGFAMVLNLSSLDGSNGFRLDGIDGNDRSGASVSSAGDVNGDGFDDIIIGAKFADPGGNSYAGESYVVFGIAPSSDVVRNGTVAGQTLAGGSGNDVLNGLAGDDQLYGNDGNDSLNGGTGNDSLNGGTGNDTLIGGGGNDAMDGGDGIDTASYLSAIAGVNVYIQFSGIETGAGVDTFTSIENLRGSGFADRLVGDAGDNELIGEGGNDIIKGKGGNDIFRGGNGNDKLTGGSGNDTMFGGAGNDTLIALAGLDMLNGGDGDDFLFGGKDADTLNGDAGNDNMRGNLGNDVMNGGSGIDEMRGGGSNDMLDGGAGHDFLFGENGADTLIGGAGNDALTGGLGGGAGGDGFADTFVYADTADGGGGFDRVKDFENGTDKIDLTSFGFTNFITDITPVSTQVGSGVKVNFGSGDVLFIENMLLADWDAGDVLT